MSFDFLNAAPAYLQDVKAQDVTFTSSVKQFNRISLAGKMFNAKLVDAEKPTYLGGTIEVVILKITPGDARTLFDSSKPYNPNDPDGGKPLCASFDGIKPSSYITNPCSSLCQGCPKSLAGSFSDGTGRVGVACRKLKYMVVALANDLDVKYVIKVNTKSTYTLSDYIKLLGSYNKNFGMVKTGLSFEQIDKSGKPIPNPILTFTPLAVLAEGEVRKVAEIQLQPELDEMLGLTDTGYVAQSTQAPAFNAPGAAELQAQAVLSQPARVSAPVSKPKAAPAPAPAPENADLSRDKAELEKMLSELDDDF